MTNRATNLKVVRPIDMDYGLSGALSTPSETGDPADGAEPGRLEAVAPDGRLDVALVFREHHADLVRLALLLVGDRACAEDVVQDVFTRLCARGRGPRADSSLTAYVRTAVVNGCRSVQRHRVLARRMAVAGAPLRRDIQESAEHSAMVAEDQRRVLAALAALPPRRREVLVLRFYLGLPVAEVAATLGISQGSVKSATARGLEALGRRLGGER